MRAIFFVLVLLIWGGAHYLVGWRLMSTLPLKRKFKRILYAVGAVAMVIAPLTLFVRRNLGDLGLLTDAMALFGYVYMGAFVLLLSISLVRDLAWLLLKGSDRVLRYARGRTRSAVEASATGAKAFEAGILMPADPARRAFMLNTVNVGVVGAVGALTAGGYYQAVHNIEIQRVNVPIKGLPLGLHGLKIAQVSDMHVGPTLKGDFTRYVVDQVKGLDADLIAITGDLIDGFVADIGHELAALGELKAPLGCYYVTGNHEFYWEPMAWSDEVERLGFTALHNANRVVERGGAKLMIGGVTDYRASRSHPELATDPHAAASSDVDVDFKLLLAHQPSSVYEAAKAGFDLQLSGHTHGGQFYPMNFFVGMVHEFTAGLHDFEQMKIYVNRGAGYWGPPLRLGAPAEITLLTLVPA